jgi:hypothetical protein
MLIILSLVILLTAAVIIASIAPSGRVTPASLGRMSERWLAEHRASRSR